MSMSLWLMLLALTASSVPADATATSPARQNEDNANNESLVHTQQLGPVSVTTRLTPKQAIIGDEIVLEILVESEKDVEILMPEFGEALERYTILDFVPQQKVTPQGRIIYSQRYTLQPASSGGQSIPPILIEFVDHRPGQPPAPEDFDAYELLTERIDFEVQSVLPQSASNELKPPLGELDALGRSAAGNWQRAAVIAVLAIALAAGAGLWVLRRAHSTIRRRNAYELARQRLDELLSDRNSASPRLSLEEFYVALSALIRRYLEDRFDVRAPELTTDEFLQLTAAGSELSREHQQLLGEFLTHADIVKFAGVGATEAEVLRSCDIAIRFLEETRENAPDVLVDSPAPAESRDPRKPEASPNV